MRARAWRLVRSPDVAGACPDSGSRASIEIKGEFKIAPVQQRHGAAASHRATPLPPTHLTAASLLPASTVLSVVDW